MQEEESAADFARRVKSEIAKKGGLADLEWDGGLKRTAPRPELKAQVQKEFFRKISVNCKPPDLSLLSATSESMTKNKSTSDLVQLKDGLDMSLKACHQRKVSAMASFNTATLNGTIKEDVFERTSTPKMMINEQQLINNCPLIKDQNLSPLISPNESTSIKRKANIAAVVNGHNEGIKSSNSINVNGNSNNLNVINQHHNLLLSETETKSG